MTARKGNMPLKSFPRIPFLLTVKGDIAMDYRVESNTAGFMEVEVPAAAWAIFRTRYHTKEETSGALQGLIKRVYTDWLPTAGYEKVDGYDLELYLEAENKICCCETWIRVSPN